MVLIGIHHAEAKKNSSISQKRSYFKFRQTCCYDYDINPNRGSDFFQKAINPRPEKILDFFQFIMNFQKMKIFF